MSAPNNTPAIQAERILDALAAMYPDEAEYPDHLLTHALGDLRHLADQHGLAFADADKNAYRIYLQEKAG